MKVQAKNVFWAVAIIFLLYAIIVAPQTSADWVRQVFQFVADAMRSIFTFFDALLGR